MPPAPPWRVLLLGGASGVGKSEVSARLAAHFGAALSFVDDVQTVLERMTTPEQYPVLHAWRTDPDAILQLDDDAMLAHTLDFAAVMVQALEPVIAQHLESAMPVVFEGDFILPELVTRAAYDGTPSQGQVRGLFLFDDEEQIARNFIEREGEAQPRRARASWCYGEWLRRECARLGLPAVAARPWSDVLERVVEEAS